MKKENPHQRARLAGALKSTAADYEASNKHHPDVQPESLIALRSHHLIAAHSIRPEIAATVAGLLFGGAA